MTALDDRPPTITDRVPGSGQGRFSFLMLLPAEVFLLLSTMFYWGLWNKEDILPVVRRLQVEGGS